MKDSNGVPLQAEPRTSNPPRSFCRARTASHELQSLVVFLQLGDTRGLLGVEANQRHRALLTSGWAFAESAAPFTHHHQSSTFTEGHPSILLCFLLNLISLT